MDRLELVEKLFAAYPNTTPSEVTFGVYVEILADIPLDDLNTVILQCIREGGAFPPSAGQLRERWRTLTQPAQLAITDAWAMVMAEMRRVGSWGTPAFADPLVDRVVRAMGWLTLCQSEDGMADRAHFLKLYGDLLARGEQASRLTPEARQLAERHQGALTHISAYLPKTLAAHPQPQPEPTP